MISQFDKTIRNILLEMYNDVDESEIDNFDFEAHEGGKKEPIMNYDDTELPVYNYMNLKIALIDAYISRKALLVYGDPGIGKSDVIKSVCKDMIAPELGRKFVVWNQLSPDSMNEVMDHAADYFVLIDRRAAELEPVDLRGIDMPTSRHEYLNPKIPKWIWYMTLPNSGGLLFLDEINQASEQVLNAFFGVVLDRQAGDVTFSTDWNVAAAANLGAEHVTTRDIPRALTERFGTLMLVADPESWFEWAEAANIDTLIVQFVKSNPQDNFYVKPTDGSAPNATPNPRNHASLSKQIRAIKKRYIHDQKAGKRPTESIYTVIERTACHTCGVSWGRKFGQFIEVFRKLNWIEMSNNADKYNTKDISNLYAYILFVCDKAIKLYGTDSHNYAETKRLASIAVADPNAFKIEDWKPIWNDVEPFLKICKGMLKGRSDMFTTLLNMLNKRDRGVTATIASCVSKMKHEPLAIEMRKDLIDSGVMANAIQPIKNQS